ncbi:MAG: PAS domain-containing protein [Pseudomonadota bacterium]
MTDRNPSGDNAADPLDVLRAAKPERDAFRYIAHSLGARYAGDSGPLPPARSADVVTLHRSSEEDTSDGDDRQGAHLLERLPIALVVADGSGVVFMNRVARRLTGFSAKTLDARGGIGALIGGPAHRAGSVRLTAFDGATFDAQTLLLPVEWAGRSCILVTIEPMTEAKPAAPIAGAALGDLLDAIPDPVVVIDDKGQVSATNAAYARLGPDPDTGRLEERLAADDLKALRRAVSALRRGEGEVGVTLTVSLSGLPHEASVGYLARADAALVLFRRQVALSEAPRALEPARTTPLDEAVAKARRMLGDAPVTIHVDRTPPSPAELELADERERFFHAIVLRVGVRASAPTTITLSRLGEAYTLRLTPEAGGVLSEICVSRRIVTYGLSAGLALSQVPGGLSIAPFEERSQLTV